MAEKLTELFEQARTAQSRDRTRKLAPERASQSRFFRRRHLGSGGQGCSLFDGATELSRFSRSERARARPSHADVA
jgi:hypothetical protein